MRHLRQHQAMLKSELDLWNTDHDLKIGVHAVPGGGKSWLPAILAERYPRSKIGWFAPRVLLRQQGAESMQEHGIPIWESENDSNPSRGTRGFIATHQGLWTDPQLYIDEFLRHDYILVIDEVHHAKLTRKGEANELASVIPRLRSRVRMYMTGTLETNDNTFIYGMEYDEIPGGWRVNRDRSADIFISYDRKTALKEGAIVPIEFYHHDGPVKFSNKGGEVVGTLSRMAAREERSGALFTALKTEMATQLLERGVDHWRSHGDQLIVVAATQVSARSYHGTLARMGVDAVLAISEETDEAKEGIKRFRRGQSRALVTCAMCYEGMDAKRATHLVCLTHIRSIPWIEQMLGRIWRASEGKGRCWAFVPHDAEMCDVIEHIRSQEISDVLGLESGGGNGNGGGPSCIIPISSGHETTTIRYLDEEVIEQEARDRVLAAMEGLGFSASDPVIEQVMRAMAEKSQIRHGCAGGLTESEEAKALRNGMTDLCRRSDAARNVPYGTTQKELYQRTRIIFSDANLEELRRAAKTCAGHCEAFLAR